MSSSKYANLPGIDTAPDVYETVDIPSPIAIESPDLSEGETKSTQLQLNTKKDDVHRATHEELDATSLLRLNKASQRFRRAEQREHTLQAIYAYRPSSSSNTPSSQLQKLPLSLRLANLREEVAALELEIGDPSNPLLLPEDVNAGELMRGLLDVRARLEFIGNRKEGRGRLVELVFSDPTQLPVLKGTLEASNLPSHKSQSAGKDEPYNVDLDRRLRDLETLLGSSATTLDDSSPLPPSLLTAIHRLNRQLAVLTQPRHIDSISRRLKVLLSDLDRMSALQNDTTDPATRRQSGQAPEDSSDNEPPQPLLLQEKILPVLNRLSPHLPHLPHILARLRTLSALHACATEFDDSLTTLESEQKNLRRTLEQLNAALQGVEKNAQINDEVVKNNVSSLEQRVEDVISQLEKL